MDLRDELDEMMLDLWVLWPVIPRRRRAGILAAAVGLATAAFWVCLLANRQGSWWLDQPGGWLPLLFLAAVAVAAHALGPVGGGLAGLLAVMLAQLAASLQGDSLFSGFDAAQPSDVEINRLGLILGFVLVGVGALYGSAAVRGAALWKRVVLLPVAPLALIVFLVWVLSGLLDSWSSNRRTTIGVGDEPQSADMYILQQLSPTHDSSVIELLGQMPAQTAEERAWVTSQITQALEQAAVNDAAVQGELGAALDSGWDLRHLVMFGDLGLPEDTLATVYAGLAALQCGLEPETGARLLAAGSLTDQLLDCMEPFLTARRQRDARRRRPGQSGPEQDDDSA